MRVGVVRTLFILLGVMAVAVPVALGAAVVVRFKDGTQVKLELPQGIENVESITLSGAGASADAPKLTDVTFTETFDAGLGAAWAGISAAGGNFEAFAKVRDGKVLVSVPAGNSWGKTGVRTTQPVLKVDPTMQARPAKILLEFDPAATLGYVAVLAPESSPDVVHAMNSWFHWYRRPNGEVQTYLRNFRTGQVASPPEGEKLPPAAPRWVLFQVQPGRVDVLTSDGTKLGLPQEWLQPGTPVFLHVHSHPGPESEPAGFSLDTVTAGR